MIDKIDIVKNAAQKWHDWFNKPENEYSEMEASDIEYFIGVLLYNHFNFELALPNLQTMEIANDFYEAAGATYKEVNDLITSVTFNTDEEAMEFLYNYVITSKELYTPSELYLLNRLFTHISALRTRIINNEAAPKPVNFSKPY